MRDADLTGWSLGYVPAIDSNERTIWIADAHRGDGQRFIVRADEKLDRHCVLRSLWPQQGRSGRSSIRHRRVRGNTYYVSFCFVLEPMPNSISHSLTLPPITSG